VTPVRPPQPSVLLAPVDQLTTPLMKNELQPVRERLLPQGDSFIDPLRTSYSPTPHALAVRKIHSRYSVSGVTPVRPPQPSVLLAPVDQLTTPRQVASVYSIIRSA
jgi:hypothetical protein